MNPPADVHVDIADYDLHRQFDGSLTLTVSGANGESVGLHFDGAGFRKKFFALLNVNKKPRKKKS